MPSDLPDSVAKVRCPPIKVVGSAFEVSGWGSGTSKFVTRSRYSFPSRRDAHGFLGETMVEQLELEDAKEGMARVWVNASMQITGGEK